MTSRLQVTDLDFDTIKTNLRSFLQQQTEEQLVEIIEKIHDAGYTYNDLKLDNILIGGYT